MLVTAFSYAGLSAAFPKSGGEYEYTKKGFGKTMGLITGAMNGIISGATVSVGFAGYFAELILLPTFLEPFGIIGLIFFLNVSGIRQSSTVSISSNVVHYY